MKHHKHHIDIQATPQQIWDILVDMPSWKTFDPFVIDVDKRPVLGQKIALRSKLAPERLFKITVTRLDAPNTMILSDGMPLGLFKGVRTYQIDKTDDTTCRFTMEEAYSGLMLGMIAKHLPDMNEAFVSFCNGLKKEAEKQR